MAFIDAVGDHVRNRCSVETGRQVAKKLEGVRVLATTNYPDQLVLKLVSTVAKAEGKQIPEVLEGFGVYFVEWAKPKYRMAFAAPCARGFLRNMDVVHQSMRNMSKEAKPPEFVYSSSAPLKLTMEYKSPRKLCSVMRGAIKGVALAYDEQVAMREVSCMNQGAGECRFELAFTR